MEVIGSPLFTTFYHYISIFDWHKSVSLGVWGFAAKEYDILTYGNYVKEMQYIQLQGLFTAYMIIMHIQTHCQSFYLVVCNIFRTFRVVVGGRVFTGFNL